MTFIRLIALLGFSAFANSGCAVSETQVSNSCRYLVDANAPEMTVVEACGHQQSNKTAFQSGGHTGWDTLMFLTSLGL